MTRKTGSIVATSLLLSGCATPPSASQPYELHIDGDDVRLSMQGDIPVRQFLELAQGVTRQIYVFDEALVEAAGPLSVLGDIQCERSAFDDFVEMLLHSYGLRTEVADAQGARCIQVRAIPARRSS